jgi:hypothetical protein
MDYDFLLSQSQPQEVFEVIKALKTISNTSYPIAVGKFNILGVDVNIEEVLEVPEVPEEVIEEVLAKVPAKPALEEKKKAK